MGIEALASSPIGTLVPISGTDGRTGGHYEHFAYLAGPLPRTVELSGTTWTAVASAEAQLARLDQAARQVPQPALLREPALRREAQSTSALEGTFAPLEAVLESELKERGGLSQDLRGILNYVVAAEEGSAWIAERHLTTGLIQNLQQTLVQGTPGEYSDIGRLRDRHVFIGPRDGPIEDARFVPAPFGDQLRAGFEEWMAWLNAPTDQLPSVVQAAMAHYQFEALHPFSDGNGRIGRLLIVLQLMQLGTLAHPLLVVSPWFEARRTQYQDGLLRLSKTGNWDEWVAFFTAGVAAAATTTHARVDALLSWQEETLQQVRAARVSGVAERLAGELIGAPVLRASQVVETHGVTHAGAMKSLRRLADLGIIEERVRANGRISFVAPRVVQLLSQ